MVFNAQSGPGIRRSDDVQDPFILTRKIGHPELIFNDSEHCASEYCQANALAKWQFYNSYECYVCQRHRYVQVFFKRQKVNYDYQLIKNNQLKDILYSTYDLRKNYNQGLPILLGSINNWILTRFVDVRLYT